MSDRLLQFQADFESPTHGLLDASTSRRPDAISLDYRTARSTGPVAIADLSSGYDSHVWYARADVDAVFIARENDEKTGWNPEQLLLTFDGAQIDELAFAFNKNGYPMLAMERPSGLDGAPEIWIYHRDPALF